MKKSLKNPNPPKESIPIMEAEALKRALSEGDRELAHLLLARRDYIKLAGPFSLIAYSTLGDKASVEKALANSKNFLPKVFEQALTKAMDNENEAISSLITKKLKDRTKFLTKELMKSIAQDNPWKTNFLLKQIPSGDIGLKRCFELIGWNNNQKELATKIAKKMTHIQLWEAIEDIQNGPPASSKHLEVLRNEIKKRLVQEKVQKQFCGLELQ